MKSVPVFLPLLLLQVIIPVTSRLHAVQVASYKKSRNVKDGLLMCALDTPNKTMSSSSLEDCSLGCTRDSNCTGFNIKNSLTCDHVMTPVLASTSRTQTPVITWRHLYWLQHQELTHLWTTWWHLYWLQHQELTHLWSREDTCTGFNIKNSLTCERRDDTCTGFNIKNSLTCKRREDTCTGFNIKNSDTCDLYNYNPLITILVAACTLYQVTRNLNFRSIPCY